MLWFILHEQVNPSIVQQQLVCMIDLLVGSQADVPDRGNVVPQQVRATLRMRNCEFSNNRRGLLLTHYNNPSNEFMDLFIRKK